MVGWQLTCSPAYAELANDQAVFIDFTGNECGIVSADTMEVVSTFPCDQYSEGIDITSDGTRAVIGNCAYNTLTLVDLMSDPPVPLAQIDSGVQCVQELDIAPNDSFAIATGSRNGLVSKFTLDPFEVLPGNPAGPWDTEAFIGGSPQDVHLNSSGTVAVQPTYQAEFFAVVDVTGEVPVLLEKISSPADPGSPDSELKHHGISLSQYDDDTFVATGTPWLYYITIGSLSGFFKPEVIETPGRPESVDISCDGTRAVVETSAGLMWIDLETTPPVVLSENFGDARIDYNSTSTVAFSADGSLLFVGGQQQIDVYDVYPDLPVLKGSITMNSAGEPITGRIYSLATLPCMAASSRSSGIEVAVDIKPRNCPNRLNVRSKGVIEVAILGSETFDVMDVDPQTVQIEGASPLRWKLKDVATPYDSDNMQGDCRDCTRKGRDGFLDLRLKFRKQDILKNIESANDGDCLVLALSGETFDGSTIMGDDVVLIQNKKKFSKQWFKKLFLSLLKKHKKEKKKSLHDRAQKHWDRYHRR
jgi:WD40 repeat protein